MTVITNKVNRMFEQGARCTLCEETLQPPYVMWTGGGDLYICASCCNDSDVKRGLMADIVHCGAIKELQDIGYRNATLVRTTVKEAEQAERMQIEEERLATYGRHQEPSRYAKPPL